MPYAHFAQDIEAKKLQFFEKSEDFHRGRFYSLGGSGLVITAGASIWLYNAWYKDYDLTGFHLFNDWGEWAHLDKCGHVYNSYYQNYLIHSMARWTGMKENQSLWTAFFVSSIFQTTIEVMDGFSAKWGFSIPDIASNLVGSGFFAGQQLLWGEQKILIKFSTLPPKHSDVSIMDQSGMYRLSPADKARDLYGKNFFTRALKDYNGETFWLSFSPADLMESTRFPKWLNIAFGYSASNLYGGFDNQFTYKGYSFDFAEAGYPRYVQFFIAPDINFSRIKVDSPFLQTFFQFLNIFKVPAPSLEFNNRDGVRVAFHWFYF